MATKCPGIAMFSGVSMHLVLLKLTLGFPFCSPLQDFTNLKGFHCSSRQQVKHSGISNAYSSGSLPGQPLMSCHHYLCSNGFLLSGTSSPDYREGH